MQHESVFFHISPDHCGEGRVARLFDLNFYSYVWDKKGEISEDIAWSRATGRAPLNRWPGNQLFTGLYRLRPWWKPPLESWRSFAFLRAHFPNARFILTLRDPEAWLLDRLTAEDGDVAKAYAAHYQVGVEELSELWLRDWHAHLNAVNAFFQDDPALIRVDTQSETLEDLRLRLDAFLPMPESPHMSGWQFRQDDSPVEKLLGILDLPAETPRQKAEEFIEDVSAFCLQGQCHTGTEPLGIASELACHWDGGRHLIDPSGSPSHSTFIAEVPDHSRGIAISHPDLDFKQRRAEAVINDILRLGRREAVNIDMEDARWISAPHRPVLAEPLLCHNRRSGARNIILWPLPEFMGPGHRGYVTPCPDRISFDDKQDKLVWRGMISGNERRDTLRPGPSSLRYLRELEAAGDDMQARNDAWEGLSRTNRMAIVRRLFRHPHCDVSVTLAWRVRHLAHDPLLAPYCTPRREPAFFYGFRYQLCMTGFDHGSNFMQMINSQSVLLNEEDGWEVYYSGRFKPWKHYIPLQRYCDDIEEKLDWARENPNECKEMSRAARDEAALFSDPALMRAIKHRVLDGLTLTR